MIKYRLAGITNIILAIIYFGGTILGGFYLPLLGGPLTLILLIIPITLGVINLIVGLKLIFASSLLKKKYFYFNLGLIAIFILPFIGIALQFLVVFVLIKIPIPENIRTIIGRLIFGI